MSFISSSFLVFFLTFMCGAIILKGKARIGFYTLSSYLFYALSFPPYVCLLLTSTVVDFFIGQQLHKTDSRCLKKCLLACTLTVNLGLLASFKYLDLMIESWHALLLNFGLESHISSPNLLLPIGISFYTFQTLSYSLDIYKKSLTPTKSFVEFACFVSFFPQLVAGPIVRAKQFLPQLKTAMPLAHGATLVGLELILLGLFKKTIIADNLAPLVDTIFANPHTSHGSLLWWGSFLFAIQIYADFSGYTDIARGIAKILGFEFPVNFQWPYLSQSIQEFWRRWHMTLSFWIRDYLYFSLGGSRVNRLRFALNMLITWALMGLWHGAAWTFVIWGLYHGLLLILLRGLKSIGVMDAFIRTIPSVVKIFLTFTLVVFGWAAFRAESLHDLMIIWSKMLSHPFAQLQLDVVWLLGVVALISCHMISYRRRDFEQSFLGTLSYPVRLMLVASSLIFIILVAGSTQSFIYFAF